MPLSLEAPVKCQRLALVIGHPGHELRVFGLVSEFKPRVYMLTDGSGRHGIPRTPSSVALISKLGATRGELFARMSDADIYRAILEQNFSGFCCMVRELAASFLKHNIGWVAGDAAEGFNPTHDLCRGLTNAAVLLTERMCGRRIANFEISLTEWEQGCPSPLHDHQCMHWTLDDHQLAEKIAAAKQYVELKNEVERALQQRGEGYFRTECLRRPRAEEPPRYDRSKPAYETWGEQRVDKGQYQTVIRFKEHIFPILKAIQDYAVDATLTHTSFQNEHQAVPGSY